jgi:prophage maintenance system killer protein
MPLYKMTENGAVEMTAEEVAQREADEAAWLAGADDRAAEANRNKRNALLAETDYLALSDNTMSAEMTTYRQALRDITTHANWPNLEDADWPTKP